MPRLADRLLVCAYVAIAAVPLAGVYTRLGDTKVFGAVPPAPRPALRVGAIVDESFQDTYTRWFEANVGFRGYSIRADNTLLYHLFGETKHGAKVALGHDAMPFEMDDIYYYNMTDPYLPSQERVDAFADQLAGMQQRLRARGTSLVPVIIPSKTTIYRDHVPPPWVRPLGAVRPSDERAYAAFRRALDARGVRHVDARELLTRPGVDRRVLWSHDARHWSAYAACQALAQVLAHHAALSGTPPIDYPCVLEMQASPDPDHPDDDLWRLLNAWSVPRRPGIAVVRPPATTPTGPRPALLVVGSSFSWTLLRDAERSQVFGGLHMNYYNQTIVESPSEQRTAIASDAGRWNALALDKDLVVLDLFESYLFAEPHYAREFLAQLERLLGATTDDRP